MSKRSSRNANASAETGLRNVLNSRIRSSLDVRSIGSRMARTKYQRGSLKKIANGRYLARWRHYVESSNGENAVPRKRTLTKELAAKYRIGSDTPGPLTKSDAQRLLDLLIAEDTGKYVPPNSAATFEQLARQYIALKEPNWGAHSAVSSRGVIERNVIAPLRSRRIDELTPVELQRFVNGFIEKGYSYSLLHKVVTFTRAIFDLAIDLDLLGKNPARKLEFKPRKRKSNRYLSIEECQAFLSALHGRDHLIVRMFIQLGFRPEELFALRRNDVGEDFIRIDEAFVLNEVVPILKTDASAGNVYIPPGLMLELRMWIASNPRDHQEWLFPSKRLGKPMHQTSYLRYVLKPLAESTGIRDLSLRVLRRTCATHFGAKANPRDTQAQLRHADPYTTLKYYQQSIPDSVKAAALAFESDLMAGPSGASSGLSITPTKALQ